MESGGGLESDVFLCAGDVEVAAGLAIGFAGVPTDFDGMAYELYDGFDEIAYARLGRRPLWLLECLVRSLRRREILGWLSRFPSR